MIDIANVHGCYPRDNFDVYHLYSELPVEAAYAMVKDVIARTGSNEELGELHEFQVGSSRGFINKGFRGVAMNEKHVLVLYHHDATFHLFLVDTPKWEAFCAKEQYRRELEVPDF